MPAGSTSGANPTLGKRLVAMAESVGDYVRRQKAMLQQERDEEVAEAASAGHEHARLSALEAAGLAITRLSLTASESAAGGRISLTLCTRGGRQLCPARLSTGDIVAVRRQARQREKQPRASAKEEAPSSVEGVLVRLDETCAQVLVEEGFDDDGDEGADQLVAVVRVGSDVTHKRYVLALDELERSADKPSHVAYSLINVLFRGMEPRFADSYDLAPEQGRVLDQLNAAQRDAVERALTAKDLSVIHGPPGTGKTFALVAYIVAEVLRGSRVLVVAPSNVAVDNIAERLAVVPQKIRFVRAGHPARVMPSVMKHTLDAKVARTDEAGLARDVRAELSQVDSQVAASKKYSERRLLRGEQRLLRKELRQREAKAVNRLLDSMQVVLATITGAGARVLENVSNAKPFDVVVIDETAQALEASCWVALLRGKKAVLAGDPFQLSPTVKSEKASSAGLGLTLLDRIFGNSELHGQVVQMLVVQYRMNKIISEWSSHEFYDDRLVPWEGVAEHRLIDIVPEPTDSLENLVQPFILVDTAGGDCEEEEQSSEGGNWNGQEGFRASHGNVGEVEIVCRLVDDLVQSGVAPADVGVISPYSRQVGLLRGKLRGRYSGAEVEIATVDSFQGREKEVICLSLVRSNQAGSVGFLSDDRRLNVAITRARRAVLLVCDSETIANHPLLARLVKYAETHGEYRSAVVDYADITGTFSLQRVPTEAIQAATNAERSRKRTAIGSKQSLAGKVVVGAQAGPSQRQSIQRKQSGSTDRQSSAHADDSIRVAIGKEIKAFTRDEDVAEKEFSADLGAFERRVVHELAEKHELGHQTVGEGVYRRIRIWNRPIPGGPGEDPEDSASGSEDANEYVSTDSEPIPQYESSNSVLREAALARRARANADVDKGKSATAPSLNVQATTPLGRKGRRRRRGKQAEDVDEDEDFDAVLAKYGAQPGEGVGLHSGDPVQQILNGVLVRGERPRRKDDQASKRLADKLSKAAKQRSRQEKK